MADSQEYSQVFDTPIHRYRRVRSLIFFHISHSFLHFIMPCIFCYLWQVRHNISKYTLRSSTCQKSFIKPGRQSASFHFHIAKSSLPEIIQFCLVISSVSVIKCQNHTMQIISSFHNFKFTAFVHVIYKLFRHSLSYNHFSDNSSLLALLQVNSADLGIHL